jgi:hypothetical protein
MHSVHRTRSDCALRGRSGDTSRAQSDTRLQVALAQQAATSEILRVISRSQHDLQPVFDMIAENALRLCGGIFSGVFRFDGELIHIGALRQLDLERVAAFRTAYPSPPSRRGTTSARS